MGDSPVAPDAPADCSDWRQGDVFDLQSICLTGSSGEPVFQSTPLGVVLLSQSCDAAQPSRPLVQVAPIVELDEKNGDARSAAAGRRPSYAPIPLLPSGRFAHLDVVSTISKAALAHCHRSRGLSTDRDVRRFAGAVARKFGRFAFPDEVVLALAPMKELLLSKARKSESSLGKALSKVYSIRVEAQLPRGWSSPPYDLRIVMIFEPGVLPDELPDGKDDLWTRTSATDENAKAIVHRLSDRLAENPPEVESYWLWQAFADALSRQCTESAHNEGVADHIASIEVELVTADEFPLSRVNNSEELDLDYLSDPIPRAPKGA